MSLRCSMVRDAAGIAWSLSNATCVDSSPASMSATDALRTVSGRAISSTLSCTSCPKILSSSVTATLRSAALEFIWRRNAAELVSPPASKSLASLLNTPASTSARWRLVVFLVTPMSRTAPITPNAPPRTAACPACLSASMIFTSPPVACCVTK